MIICSGFLRRILEIGQSEGDLVAIAEAGGKPRAVSMARPSGESLRVLLQGSSHASHLFSDPRHGMC